MQNFKKAFDGNALESEGVIVLDGIERGKHGKPGMNGGGKRGEEVRKQFHAILVLRKERLCIFAASKEREVLIESGFHQHENDI